MQGTWLDMQHTRNIRRGRREGAAATAFVALVLALAFIPPLVSWRCRVREESVRAEMAEEQRNSEVGDQFTGRTK